MRKYIPIAPLVAAVLLLSSCQEPAQTPLENKTESSQNYISLGCKNAVDFSIFDVKINSDNTVSEYISHDNQQKKYVIPEVYQNAIARLESHLPTAPIDKMDIGDGSYVGGRYVGFDLGHGETTVGALRDNSDEIIRSLDDWVSQVFHDFSGEFPFVGRFLSENCGFDMSE